MDITMKGLHASSKLSSLRTECYKNVANTVFCIVIKEKKTFPDNVKKFFGTAALWRYYIHCAFKNNSFCIVFWKINTLNSYIMSLVNVYALIIFLIKFILR